jgi:D-cysteine desulfhydrase
VTEPGRLARYPLAHLPTPLESADRLGAALGLAPGRLWVKRDDLTGLATGGNKARKLELLVGEALARGCDVLVSGGGPQSNHARSTAAAAARAGLECVLAFNADAPAPADHRPEGNQLLDVLLGAERRFLGPIPVEELNLHLGLVADELREAGRRPYLIPLGGSTPLGAAAYALAADEIVTQIQPVLGHEDIVVVTATGSGGTQAGLAAWLGHERVMGVDVGFLTDPAVVVEPLASAVAELVGRAAPSGRAWVVRGQVGDAYGATTDACRSAIRLAARTEGLLLDPVYSGKALAGLIAALRATPPDPRLAAAQAIVLLATGGQPALFTSRYEEWLTS